MVFKFLFMLLGAFLLINGSHCQRRAMMAEQMVKTADTMDVETQMAAINEDLERETALLAEENGQKLLDDPDEFDRIENEIFYKMDVFTTDEELKSLSSDPSIQSLARDVISNNAESLGMSREMSVADFNMMEKSGPSEMMMKGLWDWIKKAILAAIIVVKNIITNVINAIQNIINKVGPIIKWLLEKLKALVVSLLNWINKLITKIQDAIKSICDILKTIVSILNTAVPIIKKLGQLLGNSNLGNTLTSIANALATALIFIKALVLKYC